jgi:hypothetical protein
MSRPFRFLFPVVLPALALAFSSCVGTIYDKTYSYQRNYFKPPREAKDSLAESIIKGMEKKNDADSLLGPVTPPVGGTLDGALPPPAGLPDPAAIPGAAPAIPGLPPAAPPPPAN